MSAESGSTRKTGVDGASPRPTSTRSATATSARTPEVRRGPDLEVRGPDREPEALGLRPHEHGEVGAAVEGVAPGRRVNGHGHTAVVIREYILPPRRFSTLWGGTSRRASWRRAVFARSLFRAESAKGDAISARASLRASAHR